MRFMRLALDRYARDGVTNMMALAQDLGPLEALKAQPRLVVEASVLPTKACMLSKTYAELQARGIMNWQVRPAPHDRNEDLFCRPVSTRAKGR